MKRIALGKQRGDFYVQLEDGTSHGRMHRFARTSLANFESGSDVAVDLGEGDEYVVLGKRRHLLNNNNTAGNLNTYGARRRLKGHAEYGNEKKRRRDSDELVEMECDGCSCQRESGVVVCRDCGEATPGRLRRICPQHPFAIHSTDIFACRHCFLLKVVNIPSRVNNLILSLPPRGCGQSKMDLLEEHRPAMPEALKKTVKIIG